MEESMAKQKSICSREIDNIAQQTIFMLNRTAVDDREENEDQFFDVDEFFPIDELDKFEQRGDHGKKINMSWSSMIQNFDPLLPQRQSLFLDDSLFRKSLSSSQIIRDGQNLRRSSAIIDFLPVRMKDSRSLIDFSAIKINETIMEILNETLDESSFSDDRIEEAEITFLKMALFKASISTQTDSEMILQNEANEEFQETQLNHQGEFFFKNGQFDINNKEKETEIGSIQENRITATVNLGMLSNLNECTKSMVVSMLTKKKELEHDYHNEMELLREKMKKENSDLHEQLREKRSVLTKKDKKSMFMMETSENVNVGIETKVKNEITLKTEISNVWNKMDAIGQTTGTTFADVDNQMQTLNEERENEKNHYQCETGKSTEILKMADNKILSMKENFGKKNNDCRRIRVVQNDFVTKLWQRT